ncbi:MAG: cation:proton antiporter [Bacteroidetes bacterium 4572_114]|nr:MAG: cation:proton antiporter [Bacteroidetes bacterium 4572_114]
MEYVALIIGFLVILAGLWAIMTRKNIIRIIIGFSIFDTGLHIVIVALAYVKGGTAPILDSAVGIDDALNKIVDPVPQALVLTAIVIGLGVTALMLAFAMKMHKEKKTLDIRNFRDMKW